MNTDLQTRIEKYRVLYYKETCAYFEELTRIQGVHFKGYLYKDNTFTPVYTDLGNLLIKLCHEHIEAIDEKLKKHFEL
jgi:hypothetical protein